MAVGDERDRGHEWCHVVSDVRNLSPDSSSADTRSLPPVHSAPLRSLGSGRRFSSPGHNARPPDPNPGWSAATPPVSSPHEVGGAAVPASILRCVFDTDTGEGSSRRSVARALRRGMNDRPTRRTAPIPRP